MLKQVTFSAAIRDTLLFPSILVFMWALPLKKLSSSSHLLTLRKKKIKVKNAGNGIRLIKMYNAIDRSWSLRLPFPYKQFRNLEPHPPQIFLPWAARQPVTFPFQFHSCFKEPKAHTKNRSWKWLNIHFKYTEYTCTVSIFVIWKKYLCVPLYLCTFFSIRE